eukprot:PhM_4_TR14134/c0_g1_i1/m.39324
MSAPPTITPLPTSTQNVTATPIPTISNDERDDKKDLIIGLVVSIVGGAILAAIVFVCIRRRRDRKRREKNLERSRSRANTDYAIEPVEEMNYNVVGGAESVRTDGTSDRSGAHAFQPWAKSGLRGDESPTQPSGAIAAARQHQQQGLAPCSSDTIDPCATPPPHVRAFVEEQAAEASEPKDAKPAAPQTLMPIFDSIPIVEEEDVEVTRPPKKALPQDEEVFPDVLVPEPATPEATAATLRPATPPADPVNWDEVAEGDSVLVESTPRLEAEGAAPAADDEVVEEEFFPLKDTMTPGRREVAEPTPGDMVFAQPLPQQSSGGSFDAGTGTAILTYDEVEEMYDGAIVDVMGDNDDDDDNTNTDTYGKFAPAEEEPEDEVVMNGGVDRTRPVSAVAPAVTRK